MLEGMDKSSADKPTSESRLTPEQVYEVCTRMDHVLRLRRLHATPVQRHDLHPIPPLPEGANAHG